MVKNLKKNITELQELDKQRIFWLRLSGFISLIVLTTAIDWKLLGQNNLYWLLVVSGLTLSAVWWYWTMMLIRKLLAHKTVEMETIIDIVDDIQYIKNNLKK
jgi:hypothetical protein